MKSKGVSESHKSELSSLPGGASAYPGSSFLSLQQNTKTSFSEIARKLVWFRKLTCVVTLRNIQADLTGNRAVLTVNWTLS